MVDRIFAHRWRDRRRQGQEEAPGADPALRHAAANAETLQPLFAAGSTAASSLAAGNVFLATASPETLMVIRGGLSSAIMGEGGRIIKHAPFIVARSAILPVVAPVMLFMTVSSLITGARLDRMQGALGTLSEVLARVRQVMEAEAYAKFQSATEQLDEIWSQFEHSQRFTDVMKVELALARNAISRLHHQSGHLTSRKIGSVNDAETAVADINLFFLSSLMDIRADVLRLFLTLQDNPGYTGRRQAALRAKFEQTNRGLKTRSAKSVERRFEAGEGPFAVRLRTRFRGRAMSGGLLVAGGCSPTNRRNKRPRGAPA